MFELAKAGGALAGDERKVADKLWVKGHLNPRAIAKGVDKMIAALGLTAEAPHGSQFLAVETSGIGPDHPLSGEKPSRVLTIYNPPDFDAGSSRLRSFNFSWEWATLSAFTSESIPDRLRWPTRSSPAASSSTRRMHLPRVTLKNGISFSLFMSCGSWSGNSIDEDLHRKHFMQITKIVREIPAREPDPDDIFGTYWAKVGR